MAALVVLIIVSISGCTDKPEEVQDEVNVYIYEQTGEEGDPQEQIREFYDMVDEQSGPPIPVPLRKYAAEYELDPETDHVIPDTLKIYDPDGNPVSQEAALAMQGNIARDGAGNIITDAALLDLHIKEIGKNKYEISGIVPSLEHDSHLYKIEYSRKFGVWTGEPDEHTDYIINTRDKSLEIAPGFFIQDGEVYALLIADKEALDNEIGAHNGYMENPKYLTPITEIPDFPDLYFRVIKMSDVNESPVEGQNAITISNPYPDKYLVEAVEETGNFSLINIIKEKL
ncbi:MAG: hypothetical protein U9N61_02450 [Euryarchaeota archaeon]|nr:hypothetical protein [Euryarchaeota archaeon]